MKSASLTVDYALLQKKGTDSLEEKISLLVQNGVKNLRIKSLFVSDGFEFRAMKKRVRAFKSSFKKISFTQPVLARKTRIRSFAKNLIQNSYFDIEENTLLVGHGLPFSKNKDFFRLEKELHALGAKKTKVAVLKGRGTVEDFLSHLEKSGKREKWQTLRVVPLFIKIGNHVKNDLFGENSSESSSHGKNFCQILEENGISVTKKFTSLSEAEWFWEFVNEQEK